MCFTSAKFFKYKILNMRLCFFLFHIFARACTCAHRPHVHTHTPFLLFRNNKFHLPGPFLPRSFGALDLIYFGFLLREKKGYFNVFIGWLGHIYPIPHWNPLWDASTIWSCVNTESWSWSFPWRLSTPDSFIFQIWLCMHFGIKCVSF